MHWVHQVLKDYEHNLEYRGGGVTFLHDPSKDSQALGRGLSSLVEAKDRVSSGTWSLEGRSFSQARLLCRLYSLVSGCPPISFPSQNFSSVKCRCKYCLPYRVLGRVKCVKDTEHLKQHLAQGWVHKECYIFIVKLYCFRTSVISLSPWLFLAHICCA